MSKLEPAHRFGLANLLLFSSIYVYDLSTLLDRSQTASGLEWCPASLSLFLVSYKQTLQQ
jgi:hypothetical protein